MDFPPNRNESDLSTEEQVEWMKIACGKMVEESEHLVGHFEDAIRFAVTDEVDDVNAAMYAMVKHLEVIAEGVSSIGPILLRHFCTEHVTLALVRDKIQEQVGPDHVVDIEGSFFGMGAMFSVKDVGDVVPDDLSELDTDE